jgi:hypothetical protein
VAQTSKTDRGAGRSKTGLVRDFHKRHQRQTTGDLELI